MEWRDVGNRKKREIAFGVTKDSDQRWMLHIHHGFSQQSFGDRKDGFKNLDKARLILNSCIFNEAFTEFYVYCKIMSFLYLVKKSFRRMNLK
jgi:hypothetical protein